MRHEKDTRHSDAQLQEAVTEELRWDTRVPESAIDASARGGVVTLTGVVDSWAARLAAEEAAQRVAGVRYVANALHVLLPSWAERTDVELARAVRATLEWSVVVPHERLEVSVTNGIVALRGTVESGAQRESAAAAVRNLIGVRDVQNWIVVAPPAPPDTIREAIDRTLLRHALVAPGHVHIDVSDGTVTLSGDVTSLADRVSIEQAVRDTLGVREVDNLLVVEP